MHYFHGSDDCATATVLTTRVTDILTSKDRNEKCLRKRGHVEATVCRSFSICCTRALLCVPSGCWVRA